MYYTDNRICKKKAFILKNKTLLQPLFQFYCKQSLKLNIEGRVIFLWNDLYILTYTCMYTSIIYGFGHWIPFTYMCTSLYISFLNIIIINKFCYFRRIILKYMKNLFIYTMMFLSFYLTIYKYAHIKIIWRSNIVVPVMCDRHSWSKLFFYFFFINQQLIY